MDRTLNTLQNIAKKFEIVFFIQSPYMSQDKLALSTYLFDFFQENGFSLFFLLVIGIRIDSNWSIKARTQFKRI
ncbi:hypothetical protein B8V81_3245 [Paenibacillus pasadenensis]|uniref:Uncharacterized protein n=1 Tax=Paenibacillus pasadenensis TaxID=217090 RepID=A0A2N5N396_9BACL|nr:hypothetical protein B8V81_3245 [Paenibacillus pasadenensis]